MVNMPDMLSKKHSLIKIIWRIIAMISRKLTRNIYILYSQLIKIECFIVKTIYVKIKLDMIESNTNYI